MKNKYWNISALSFWVTVWAPFRLKNTHLFYWINDLFSSTNEFILLFVLGCLFLSQLLISYFSSFLSKVLIPEFSFQSQFALQVFSYVLHHFHQVFTNPILQSSLKIRVISNKAGSNKCWDYFWKYNHCEYFSLKENNKVLLYNK